MNLERLPELIRLLAENGRGVTIRPIRKGTRIGGIGSEHTYRIEGWEVGYLAGWGGDELAVGETIHDAIAAAIQALKEVNNT
jgi:hypothetical protein